MERQLESALAAVRHARNRIPVDVHAYGARGDGITDDTPYLQTALDVAAYARSVDALLCAIEDAREDEG